MQRCGNNLHKRGNHTTKDNELLLISQIWKGFWSVILVLTFKITKLTAGAVKERTYVGVGPDLIPESSVVEDECVFKVSKMIKSIRLWFSIELERHQGSSWSTSSRTTAPRFNMVNIHLDMKSEGMPGVLLKHRVDIVKRLKRKRR